MAVPPPGVIASKVPTFTRPFALHGMGHTTAGYCVVSAYYNDKGDLLEHRFGVPQTFPQFVTTELLRIARASLNRLLGDK